MDPKTPNYEEWSKLCDIDVGCFWDITDSEVQTPCLDMGKTACLWFSSSDNQGSMCYISQKNADAIFATPYSKLPAKADLILSLTIVATIFFMICAVLLVVLVKRQQRAVAGVI